MCGAFEGVPESHRCPVRRAECLLELLDLAVRIGVAGIELAPSTNTTAKPERQIVRLAKPAPGLIVRRHRAPKRLRGHDAVRFGCRVATGVELLIGREFPRLAGQPSQHATLDSGEVGAYQNVAGGRADRAACN